ncbi:ABC transporter substrate-binding protein [Prochlorothrix hollandica]|uniref:ABC transporter substrate-binding protein n=1 Tax=Prochlorothrix hollandica PCC 9006 = CALU 1027 TaxID=317619 RepID=A0A0M2PW85_PROHO|nr:ABC transporter substrate-binding protein [Prochlorothrix hollandica]KKI98923.1 ABC transporter substrate-binding protein [Prochlorothrix hollandica PCC 9006 = CALU 1027]
MKQWWRLLGWTLTLVLLVACGGEPSAGSKAAASPTLTVLGTLTGSGETELAAVFAPFTAATGIAVVYEGTDAFDTVLPVRVEAGDPPDFALFPQLGLLRDFVDRGQLVPLDTFLDRPTLADTFAPDLLALGTVGDRLYGFSLRTYLKSLVWYRPQVFAAKGYAVPETWEQWETLRDRIIADGGVPWCLGLDSGDSTGWVGTDWIETLLLRTGGPEIYDQWTSHQIPFTHPAVKAAFEQFGRIAQDPRQTLGGSTGALSLSFQDAPLPLFSDPPGCYLHQQASFISAFFPPGVQADETVDIFPFPALDPAYGRPLVVGDLLVGMLQDSKAGQAFLAYLLTPESQAIWATFGGHLSPYQTLGLDAYGDRLSQRDIEILGSADTLRYDGSDLMPRAVNRTFASGVVDYLSGVPLDQVLETIEASWTRL